MIADIIPLTFEETIVAYHYITRARNRTAHNALSERDCCKSYHWHSLLVTVALPKNRTGGNAWSKPAMASRTGRF
ncbi:MAG: hypothetical protein LCH20_04745 [Proteobacteria bacterium]|nr:hypothetical protein [Pseudomonadota bacterium]